MNLFKLNQQVLKVFSFFCLVACGFQFVNFGQDAISFFNLYAFLIIAIPSIYLLFFHEYVDDDSQPVFRSRDFVAIALFLLFQLVIYFYGIERFSLWFDELEQLSRSVRLPFMEASGYHFQPPLDYIFQKATLSIFRISEFTVRFNTVIFAALANTLLFSLIKRITGSYSVSLLLCVLVVFEAWYFKYSFDARPVALGCFTLMLFIINFISALKSESSHLSKSDFYSILSSGLLFLVSLGYQPLMLVFVILLLIFISKIFISKNITLKQQLNKLLKPLILCVLLFLPVQLKIYLDSLNLVVSKNFQNRLTSIALDSFSDILKDYAIYLWYLAIFIFFAFITRLFKNKNKSTSFEAHFFVSATLMFFFGSFLIFGIPINFRFAPHYVVFVLPLFAISVAYLYKYIEDSFSVTVNKKIFNFIFLFCSILLLPQFELTFKQEPRNPMPREDLKQAYSVVLENSSNKDYLLSLSFPVQKWSPVDINLGSPFYYIPKITRLKSKGFAEIARNGQIPMLSFYSELKNNSNFSNIYIIINRSYEQELSINYDELKTSNNLQLYYFENLLLIKLENSSGNLQKSWFAFMDLLGQKTKAPKSWVYNALLAQKYLILKKKDDFIKTLEILESSSVNNHNEPILRKVILALEEEAQAVFL